MAAPGRPGFSEGLWIDTGSFRKKIKLKKAACHALGDCGGLVVEERSRSAGCACALQMGEGVMLGRAGPEVPLPSSALALLQLAEVSQAAAGQEG